MYDVERKLGVLEFVEDRSAATLLPVIQTNVVPGTEIHSDQWAAYNGIPFLPVNPPYKWLSVNHSENFVDENTGCHINHVEQFWQKAKRKFKHMNGTYSDMVPSYLDEFMWCQFNGHQGIEVFNNLLEQISQWYPPPSPE